MPSLVRSHKHPDAASAPPRCPRAWRLQGSGGCGPTAASRAGRSSRTAASGESRTRRESGRAAEVVWDQVRSGAARLRAAPAATAHRATGCRPVSRCEASQKQGWLVHPWPLTPLAASRRYRPLNSAGPPAAGTCSNKTLRCGAACRRSHPDRGGRSNESAGGSHPPYRYRHTLDEFLLPEDSLVPGLAGSSVKDEEMARLRPLAVHVAQGLLQAGPNRLRQTPSLAEHLAFHRVLARRRSIPAARVRPDDQKVRATVPQRVLALDPPPNR